MIFIIPVHRVQDSELLPVNSNERISGWDGGIHFHVLFESDSYALEKILKVVEEKFSIFFHET